jgi:hypothetical protein
MVAGWLGGPHLPPGAEAGLLLLGACLGGAGEEVKHLVDLGAVAPQHLGGSIIHLEIDHADDHADDQSRCQ